MKIFKYIINVILLAAIIFIVYIMINNIYIESKIKAKDFSPTGTRTSTGNNVNEIHVTLNGENKIERRSSEPRKLKYVNVLQGYNVIAKLYIPKIELITDVLEEYSEWALKTSVTKFYGPNPNDVGNLCITGHNYINRNMFNKLKRLNVGDNLFLTDGYEQKIEYEIYDIFKVGPNDESILNQDTNGVREITLITCTSDSKQRIIVKAREI